MVSITTRKHGIGEIVNLPSPKAVYTFARCAVDVPFLAEDSKQPYLEWVRGVGNRRQ